MSLRETDLRLPPIKAETDQEIDDRKRKENIDASVARWKAKETELLADETPIGELKRSLSYGIGEDNTVIGAFSEKGYFPGATQIFISSLVDQYVNAWTASLSPGQRAVLDLPVREDVSPKE